MEVTIREIEAAKSEEDYGKLLEKYKYTFEKQLYACDDDQQHIGRLLETAVSSGQREVVMLFTKAVIESRKFAQLTWKNLFSRILATMMKGKQLTDDSFFHYCYHECFGIAMAEVSLYQTNANVEDFCDNVPEVLLFSLRSNDEKLFYFARGLVASLADGLEIVTKVTLQLADEFRAYVHNGNEAAKPSTIAWDRLSRFSDYVSDKVAGPSEQTPTTLSELYESILPHICAIFRWLSEMVSSYRVSYQSRLYKSVLAVICDGIAAGAIADVRVLAPIVAAIGRQCVTKDEQLRLQVRDILAAIAEREPSLVADQLDFLLHCLSEEAPFMSEAAQVKIFEFAADRVLQAVPRLVTSFVWRCPRWQRRSNMLPLLTAVAQHSPHVIKEACIEAVFELYEKCNELWVRDELLLALAVARPDDVAHFDCFIKRCIIGYGRHDSAKAAALLLTKVASNLEKADEYVTFLNALLNVQWFKENDSLHFLKCILSIGEKYPALRSKHFRLLRNCRSKVRSLQQPQIASCHSSDAADPQVVAEKKARRKRTSQEAMNASRSTFQETKKRKLRSGKVY